MYAIVLNDMRSPNVENVVVVRISEDRQELVDWYREQLEPSGYYKDGTWGKVFKKGSDLEWFNPCSNLEEDNNFWGGIWKVQPWTEVGMSAVKAY